VHGNGNGNRTYMYLDDLRVYVQQALQQVTLTPSSVNFGNQGLGITSSPQAFTLTNNQSTTLTGIGVSITGANGGDFGQSNNCGTTLAANASCSISVTFTPTALGSRSGTLSVTDSAGTQTASLSGTGISGVTLTPPLVDFGNQGVGTMSSPQTLTLANNQGTAVTGISVSITGANGGDFGQGNNCGTTLAANASCSINVTFTPSGYGTRSATLSVSDSAGTQSSSLTGTGTDITAPVTQITAPADGATVSGTVTVTATASDNVGVTAIQIYLAGTLRSSGTSSPLNYSWNTTGVGNGSHTLYSVASDAAGNLGTSTTVTVTVSNTTVQLFQNPGFETGNLSNWSAGGVYLPSVVTGHAHSGSYSAQLGASTGSEPNGESSLYQTVTIPGTATSATLYFQYWAATTDTIANDWQEVQVQDTSGNKLTQVMKVCANNQQWVLGSFNLIAYKGQTVRIYFNVHGNGNGNRTYMYLDDLRVYVK
jgi:Bacterial Ig domain/Cep192 domain 4